jgi:transcriptional regulator with XRE-family HTH domain
MLLSEQVGQLALLSKYLSKKQLTQIELARATGVHQSQISRILAGNVRRASKNVIKLCRYAESLPAAVELPGEDKDAVFAEIVSMLGQSASEKAAFRQVIASLNAWRRTWKEPR